MQLFKLDKNKPDSSLKSLYEDLRNNIRGKYDKQLSNDTNVKFLKTLLNPFYYKVELTAEDIFYYLDKGNAKNFQRYIKKTLNRIREGATYLYKSIDYWTETVSNNNASFIKMDVQNVSDIKLLGSDLHHNGLGVALVTFKLKGGDQKAMILKPDAREIEYSLLSSNTNSLASKFNKYKWLINGEEKTDEKIQTIKMMTSSQAGSLVEKVIGKEKNSNDIENVNFLSLIKSIIFSCLSGISDLHHENILWNNGELYLIDADVALTHPLILNIKKTMEQDGFPQNVPQIRIVSLSKRIINDVYAAFNGKKGRIVPINTSSFDSLRFAMVYNNDFPETYINTLISGSNSDGRLIGVGLKYLTGSNETKLLCDNKKETDLVKDDLFQRQIPYYEYNYNSGKIEHNNVYIYKGLTLDDIRDKMLRDKIVTDPIP